MKDTSDMKNLYLNTYITILQQCYSASFIKSWVQSVKIGVLNAFFYILILLPLVGVTMLAGGAQEMLPNHPKIVGLLWITLGLFTTYGYFRVISWFYTHRTTKIYNPVYGHGSMYQSTLLSQLNGFPALLSLCTGTLVFQVVNLTTHTIFAALCALVTYIIMCYTLFRLYRPLFTVSDPDTFKALVESETQNVNKEYFSETFLTFTLVLVKNSFRNLAAILVVCTPCVLLVALFIASKVHNPVLYLYILFASVTVGLIYAPFLIQKFYKGGVLTFVYRWSYLTACFTPLLALYGLNVSMVGVEMFTQLPLLSPILCIILDILITYKIFQRCKNIYLPQEHALHKE